jgi:hypothetical protein
MQKFIFVVLLFGVFVQSSACKCMRGSIAQNYLDAEIVALVTIEKTYGDKESNVQLGGRLYSADLKFEKIYKGIAFKTLNVFGTTTYASSGACEKLIEKGEKYLILLSKNKDGFYYVSSCSTMPRISDDKFVKNYERIFNIIEKNKSKLHFSKFAQYEDLSEEYDNQKKQIINDFLKLDNKVLVGKLGIYKVKINNDGKISEVKAIQKIGIKEKLIQELMKKNLSVYDGFSTSAGEYFILLEL